MSIKRFYWLFVFVFGMTNLGLAQYPALIPYPNNLVTKAGRFDFQPLTVVSYSNIEFKNEANYLVSGLLDLANLKAYTCYSPKLKSRSIVLKKNLKIKHPEAYTLQIKNKLITINAATSKGVFYGIQSLLQLLANAPNKLSVNCLSIDNDQPQFAWRGMHLDCSRHFFKPDFIKKYIDLLASYKFNYFHWHLTDDQGWRIEIKKYPKLTQIGAYRAGSMKGHYTDQQFDSIPYGGFYTQSEIRELVAYAQNRHIEIVPEIDMPGHARAAIAAYPELSCTGKQVPVGMKWGIEKEVLCPSPFTLQFIDDIFSELTQLFPCTYIHIGGDEVLKDEWDASMFCKELMQKEQLKDAIELQAFFMNKIEKIANKYHKKAIGWDEIMEKNSQTNATIMSWRGMEAGIEAAKNKHAVIMTPIDFCYFDHYQGNNATEPLAIGGFTPLEQVYEFNPCPDSIAEPDKKYILGAQGNVWTEYLQTPEMVEYMAVPRLCALSEVLWTRHATKKLGYTNFKKRLIAHQPFLIKKQIHYSQTFLTNEADKK